MRKYKILNGKYIRGLKLNVRVRKYKLIYFSLNIFNKYIVKVPYKKQLIKTKDIVIWKPDSSTGLRNNWFIMKYDFDDYIKDFNHIITECKLKDTKLLKKLKNYE